MCHADDSNPPPLPDDLDLGLGLPPLAGGAAAEVTTATSADGTTFSVALALSSQPREPAVVILPDVRGLYRFYAELTERFAQAGHHAIAIDYFGRTAGTGERGEDFEYMPHVQQTRPETVAADVRAAIDRLRRETGATTIVTVGFCFGGAQSFMQGTRDHGLAGVVGFYGSLVREGQRWTLDRAPEISVPVLGLFAGDDGNITADQVAEFEARLVVPHEMHTYPGAPHSFFDRRQEQYADASADAWTRVLEFIETQAKVEA
jgi:carboxymethylenebutenolidase